MYRALKSFCGAVSMEKGEEKVIYDQRIVSDLIKAGYIEEITVKTKSKSKPKNKNKWEG